MRNLMSGKFSAGDLRWYGADTWFQIRFGLENPKPDADKEELLWPVLDVCCCNAYNNQSFNRIVDTEC